MCVGVYTIWIYFKYVQPGILWITFGTDASCFEKNCHSDIVSGAVTNQQAQCQSHGRKFDVHRRVKGQLLVAPKLLMGLTCIGGLTWGCTEGLAILVVLATVAGVVRQVRAAVSLASLAKLLGANLLRDSLRWAPRRTFLGAGISPATGLSLLGLFGGPWPPVKYLCFSPMNDLS